MDSPWWTLLVVSAPLLVAACGSESSQPFMADDSTFVSTAAPAPGEPAAVLSPDGEQAVLPIQDSRTVAQRVADASTATRVQKAVANDRSLLLYDLDIHAFEGTVTLEGRVDPAHHPLIIEVARRVAGVSAVIDRLDVEPDAIEAVSDNIVIEPVYHTVRRGETIGAIAERYDVTVGQIRQLNGLRGTTIRAGQRLRIQ
jgi:LysM repeat protein